MEIDFYKPANDPECVKYWPDAQYGIVKIWRFLWVKKGTPIKGQSYYKKDGIKIWAYRYIPLCGRLWWCEEWLGTRSNLFPFSAFIPLMFYFVFLPTLFTAMCCGIAICLWEIFKSWH